MSFLSSAIVSSSLSGPTSPLRSCHVYPSFLPTHAVHLLYAAILDSPNVLLAIENDLLFEDDTITHELIRLFHGISCAQQLQLTNDVDIPLCLTLEALPTHILSILHTHGFGTFVENLEPRIIYPVFHRIYLSLPQDQCDTYVECIDQFLLTSNCTLDSPLPVPILPPTLAARISSPPISQSSTVVNPSADDSDDYTPTIPIPADSARSIHLPNGTDIISSPTRVLPQPKQLLLPPASANTHCFQCFCNGHYRVNCSEYHCPNCRVTTLGHPARNCLLIQCDYCRNWGHRARFCLHRNSAICSQPGHLMGDCPFERLSTSQSSAAYGGPSPSTI